MSFHRHVEFGTVLFGTAILITPSCFIAPLICLEGTSKTHTRFFCDHEADFICNAYSNKICRRRAPRQAHDVQNTFNMHIWTRDKAWHFSTMCCTGVHGCIRARADTGSKTHSRCEIIEQRNNREKKKTRRHDYARFFSVKDAFCLLARSF